jgi:hypothetical protein
MVMPQRDIQVATDAKEIILSAENVTMVVDIK